eukprot:scaffold2191_cov392-Prasinococcus_capsulatus_cf.AAC.15
MGVDVHLQNNAGNVKRWELVDRGTPLHAAAGNGQTECARLLMLCYGADGMRCNELMETPKDIAASKELGECAAAIDLCIRANMLRSSDPADW